MRDSSIVYTRGLRHEGISLVDKPTMRSLLPNVYNSFNFAYVELLVLQVGDDHLPFVNNSYQDQGEHVR